MSVLRYLKGHLAVVVAVFVLLGCQVVCDLAVPGYTSNIVDIGIQQGGIEDVVPQEMRASTFDELVAAVGEAKAPTLRAAYQPSSDDTSVMVLSSAYASGETRQALNDLLARPEAELLSRMDGTSVEGLSEDVVQQRAVAFVRLEYEQVGTDLEALQMGYLLRTGGKMLGLVALSLLLAVGVGALASRTGAFIARDLRERLFAKVLSFSRADMQGFGTASLITRCTNDVQLVQMTVIMVLRMVLYAPIMGIAASVMVATTAPSLAWIVVVAVVAILCVVIVLMKATLPKFRIMQKLVDRVNLVSREALTGSAVVRAFGRERREEERFDAANTDLTNTSLFTNRAMSAMMPIMMLVMNATSVAIMWFGGQSLPSGAVQVGDLIAFINYAMQVCMSFMMITMVAIMLPRAQVAADRIDEVLGSRTAVDDPAASDQAPAPAGGWRGEVRFEHVSLRFDDAEDDVLHDVSFTAVPGTTTAVIGSTGSGKSTLVRMIPRFYDATEGRVLVDGVDVRAMAQEDLRGLIGYVPQKAVLFSGTVRSNIAYADPDMPEECVRAAADVAMATEFVLQKPEGFDAPISQGGSNVSGGQRQRLSIARAVAANPLVYVFDDAFSALDLATDAAVRANLKQAAANATVVVVAQRVATVLEAEQIVVLDEGRVVGKGTHLELMESCSAYREIAESQLSQEELARVAQAQRGGEAR